MYRIYANIISSTSWKSQRYFTFDSDFILKANKKSNTYYSLYPPHFSDKISEEEKRFEYKQ